MLKKISLNDYRVVKINSIIEILSTAEFYSRYISNITDIMLEWYKLSILTHISIDENVKIIYGESNDPNNDMEWKLAKILFMLYLWSRNLNKFNNDNYEQLGLLIKNVITSVISLYENEYKISWGNSGGSDNDIKWIQYEPIDTKTIIDNLKDIDNNKAKPIEEILKPMKSDEELIGYISKINSEVEQINVNDLSNLNSVDKSIAKKAKDLSKQVINNVDSAKGHKGRSQLSIKDIAHNYALNVSLLYKLEKINNLNKESKNE